MITGGLTVYTEQATDDIMTRLDLLASQAFTLTKLNSLLLFQSVLRLNVNNVIFICLSFVVELHVNVFRGIIKGLFTGHVQYMDFSAEPKKHL